MENYRKLNDCMMLETHWQEAVRDMETYGWDIQTQVELYAGWILGQILADKISLGELRGGVAWANALDGEAVEKYSQDGYFLEADKQEAKARRLAHHAGRTALSQVKTARRRMMFEVRNKLRNGNFASRIEILG